MTEQVELLAAVEAYHDLGITVIPFILTYNEKEKQYDKKPLVETWRKWEMLPQTEEEFKALNWHDANAYGVLLATQAKNGLYLSVVDYDVKGKISEEAKAKGKEILKDFPVTRVEQTVNGGIHNVYWSKVKTPIDGTFHDSTGLELLGEKKLCLMAPSYGYKNIGSDIIAQVENLEETFNLTLKKNGFSHSEETEVEHQLDNFSFSISRIVDLKQLTKNGDEYYGAHPIHGSDHGHNFYVNTKTNSWHCFRHDSGGGVLQLFAVKEGIIKCEQAKKRALRGKKFKETLHLAAAQGLIDEKVLSQSEINPVILAKDIMEDYAFVVDHDTNTLFYYNEENVYNNKTEQLLQREIAKRLDENYKSHYCREIESFITATAPLVKMDNENLDLLAVGNGILNLKTRELKPFSKDIYITRKLKWKYDKDAKCPKIDAFKMQILPEEHKRLLAQEYEGYCLYGDLPFKKAYIANGKTDTGKTVHQNIINFFIGEENTSHQTIQSLNHNRFSPAELYKKMLNSVDDLPSSIVRTTGFFKMALGHGTIPAERKGKDPFYFSNTAKFWINANDLPPIAKWEDTDAYFNRLLINDYEVQIPIEKQNENLIYELTTQEEMSGFLNQALNGLDRLLKNKHFTYTKSQEENRIIYTKRSDAAKWFAEAYIEITDNYDDYLFHDDIFHLCVTVCHSEKIKKIPSAGELKNAMQKNCIGAYETKIRKVIGHEPKSGKELKRLVPAWRYVKFVPVVPNVRLFEIRREKNEKTQITQINENINPVEKSRTNGTNGTEQPYFNKCYFCGKPIFEPICVTNDVTENKPAHQKCYDDFIEGQSHEEL